MQLNLTVEGRATNEPRLEVSQNGQARTWINLAHDTRYRNKQGEWVDGKTVWLSVTCWGALAENVVNSVNKGDVIIVNGRDIRAFESGGISYTGVTAENIGHSLRFDTAKSDRLAKRQAQGPATVRTADGEMVPAEAGDDAWQTATPATAAA